MTRATFWVLKFLGERVVSYLSASRASSDFQYPSLLALKSYLSKSGLGGREIANALYYLRQRKYIKTEGGVLILTALGMVQFLKQCELLTDRGHPRGRQTIIIVTTPEKERRWRDFLRYKLSQEEFILVSRGVYMSPYKLSRYFSFAVRLFNMAPYVKWGVLEESIKAQKLKGHKPLRTSPPAGGSGVVGINDR